MSSLSHEKQPTPSPSHFPLAQVPLYCTRKTVPLLLADFDLLSIWKDDVSKWEKSCLADVVTSANQAEDTGLWFAWKLTIWRLDLIQYQGNWKILMNPTTFGHHCVREGDIHIALLGEHSGENLSAEWQTKRKTNLFKTSDMEENFPLPFFLARSTSLPFPTGWPALNLPR